ncbi:GyrI-like domain-containing protein [Flavobacterium sp.]|jgi:effector-binding domain-containing protein|uniref:GyrI-like domain-containing protein n=1 Tax=Flavobacterium sp. TaxID=239 RepID=UPI0037BE8C31
MRILKYIFLLLLLFFIAFVVFVATQPGDYKIMQSKEIAASKEELVHFVADTNSFDDWSPWEQDEARIANLSKPASDSLFQKITINNELSQSYFAFQSTKKGTRVTWQMQGTLDLKSKIMSVLNGGANPVIGSQLEKGLENINYYLVNEIGNYSIKTNGIVTQKATNYIQQQTTCYVKDFEKKSKAMVQNMLSFVTKNKIKTTGVPFVRYTTKKSPDQKTAFAICIPISERIYTMEGSQISGGRFEAFEAVKTTLTGDYSHNDKAWRAARGFINKNKLTEATDEKAIEVYKVSLPKERKPSKWVTEIYIPVQKQRKEPQPEVVESPTREVVDTPEQ